MEETWEELVSLGGCKLFRLVPKPAGLARQIREEEMQGLVVAICIPEAATAAIF